MQNRDRNSRQRRLSIISHLWPVSVGTLARPQGQYTQMKGLSPLLQSFPPYPRGQSHWKVSQPTLQVPPFWHGLDLQKVSLALQPERSNRNLGVIFWNVFTTDWSHFEFYKAVSTKISSFLFSAKYLFFNWVSHNWNHTNLHWKKILSLIFNPIQH